MTIQEFEEKLQSIRAKNGWEIALRCAGIWLVEIYDKETGELLAHTGSTGLAGVLAALEMPFDKCPWV